MIDDKGASSSCHGVLSEARVTAGELVVTLIAALEKKGIPSVYLRSYENLPDEVGNDADLLVPTGKRRICEACLIEAAVSSGWRHLKTAEFGPLAVYLANPQTTETLHIDLFDRLDWHALELADAHGLFERRGWSGLVHIPAPSDEVYLNLITRLVYQGQVRPKHREQAEAFVARHGLASLRAAFDSHLGSAGDRLARALASRHWEPTDMDRRLARLAAFRHHGLRRPWRLVAGLSRYGFRIVRKLLRPPGAFLVFQGADRAGKKSALVERITPWCAEWNAGRTPYRFHWKPDGRPPANAGPSTPADPPPVAALLNAALLFHHVLGCWWSWLTRVYPAVVSSHVVIGECHTYGIFPDPSCFLSLPPSIRRLAVALCPRPDLVVELVDDPQAVDPREIAVRRNRRKPSARNSGNVITVCLEGEPDAVLRAVKHSILSALTT